METKFSVAEPKLRQDASTLREIAETLSNDGYPLIARVLRQIARRLDRA